MLVAFPNDVEITTSNHATGWLRFLARGIPSVSQRHVTFEMTSLGDCARLTERGGSMESTKESVSCRLAGQLDEMSVFGLQSNPGVK